MYASNVLAKHWHHSLRTCIKYVSSTPKLSKILSNDFTKNMNGITKCNFLYNVECFGIWENTDE